jgi:CBS domain-containing protein
MSAGRICSRVIVTAAPGETVVAAARRMADYDVGTVVVVEGDGPRPPLGILTDRDIAIRGVAAGLDLTRTPVSQLRTTPVHTVDEATPIEQAVGRMASSATRRLVVTGPASQPVGMLSLDDVLDLLSAEAGAIGRLLGKQHSQVLA